MRREQTPCGTLCGEIRDRGELPIPELTETEAADFPLPRRAPHSHKYNYGRALVIAGSRGYSGAPVLAANACERSGAGLTQLLVPESLYTIAAAGCEDRKSVV